MGEYRPHARHDPESDAIYVSLRDEEIVRSVSLDDLPNIDYSAAGAVVGVEFLGVGGGLDLADVPYRHKIEKLIGELGQGIRIFA